MIYANLDIINPLSKATKKKILQEVEDYNKLLKQTELYNAFCTFGHFFIALLCIIVLLYNIFITSSFIVISIYIFFTILICSTLPFIHLTGNFLYQYFRIPIAVATEEDEDIYHENELKLALIEMNELYKNSKLTITQQLYYVQEDIFNAVFVCTENKTGNIIRKNFSFDMLTVMENINIDNPVLNMKTLTVLIPYKIENI